MSHWYNDGALVVWRLKKWQCIEGMREDVESFRGCKMFVPEGLGKGEGLILLTPVNNNNNMQPARKLGP